MHLTLLVPGALVPAFMAPDLAGAIKAPRLEARLARAAAVDDTVASEVLRGAAHLAWLNPRIFGADGDAPIAPYEFASLTGSPPLPGVQLFLAELVHFGFARDHLVIETFEVPPNDHERQALLADADIACRTQQCRLIEAEGRVFLTPESPWAIVTTPLAAARSRSASTALPTGPDSARWTRIHNEIQMQWHQHAVNVAREASGKPAVNGIWLHGGGRWHPLPEPQFSAVHALDPGLQGAALAAGMQSAPPGAAPRDGSLIVRDELFEAASRNDWSRWIDSIARFDAWLASLSSATVDFVLAGRDRVRTRRSSPWDRFLRWRAMPLAEALAE